MDLSEILLARWLIQGLIFSDLNMTWDAENIENLPIQIQLRNLTFLFKWKKHTNSNIGYYTGDENDALSIGAHPQHLIAP